MIYISRLLILIMLFVGASADAAAPPIVSGVWKPGHNITEPRPRSSKFMKVLDAGFLLAGSRGVFYRVEIQLLPGLETPYFVQVIFPNPQDAKSPFVEEAVVSEPSVSMSPTTGPVKGLRIGQEYRIRVKIYRRKGDPQPLDVVVQSVRSYIDTTGSVTKLKRGLKAQ